MTKIPNNKPTYNSSGHSYLEFDICLVFDAWNLGFRGLRPCLQAAQKSFSMGLLSGTYVWFR